MIFANYSKKIKEINPAKSAYVAFLDILGFGKLTLTEDHDKIRALYQSIIRTNLDLTLTEVRECKFQHYKMIDGKEREFDTVKYVDASYTENLT